MRRPQRVRAVLAATALGLAMALPLVVAAADHSVEARTGPAVFSPARLTVEVGDTVTWTMAPGDPHTVTSGTYNASGTHPDGLFDSGFLRPGETFAHTFAEAGEFRYVCSIHANSGMVGTVTVVDPAAAPEPGPTSLNPGGADQSGDALTATTIGVILGVVLVVAIAARLIIARRRS